MLALGVLSLTLFSFASSSRTSNPHEGRAIVNKLALGNYLMEEVEFSAWDEEALTTMENSFTCNGPNAAMGFFVRCRSKCDCKFSHATIAGGGCCTSLVESPEQAEIDAADQVRAAVDAIMEKYM